MHSVHSVCYMRERMQPSAHPIQRLPSPALTQPSDHLAQRPCHTSNICSGEPKDCFGVPRVVQPRPIGDRWAHHDSSHSDDRRLWLALSATRRASS